VGKEMTEKNLLVSIIVRTKDRPAMLENALKSIAGQTYRPIEVVLVNDGGCDLDTAVLMNILGDVSLKYVRLKSNTGRAKAGNVGIEHSRGKYIGFLDDDDVFYSDHVERLVGLLEQNTHNIVYSDSLMAYKDHDELGTEDAAIRKELVFSYDFDYDTLIFENYIPFMCLLFERDVMLGSGGLDESFDLYEDHDLLIRLGEKHPFLHVQKTTAEYYQWSREVQIAQRGTDDHLIKDASIKLFAKHADKHTPERIYKYKGRKDEHIGNLGTILGGRDTHIGNLEKIFKDQDSHIQHLGAVVEEKDAAINRLKAALAEGYSTIDKIYRSRGWKTLLFYYRIRDRAFPDGSFRKILVQSFFRIIKRMKHSLWPSKTGTESANRGDAEVIDKRLIYSIETNLSRPLIVGRGNVLFLSGWCYHTTHEIKKMVLLADDIPHEVSNCCLARPEILAEQCKEYDRNGHSLNSGFWIPVPYPEINSERYSRLVISVVLKNGEECRQEIGTIKLIPTKGSKAEDLSPASESGSDEPFVAICMTTYNPDMKFFSRQINSIKQQTYKNWICLISDDHSHMNIYEEIKDFLADDHRFLLYRNTSNLGFYHNFEECLMLVPKEASFVAFSDQDDYWHPDKLAVLVAQMDRETTLAYSDMNIVNDKGELLHDTYWTTRKNNYTDLDFLLFANTVTGAASLIRRDLVEFLVPFPRQIGESYHDHWIACVALAMGKVTYVDRPLYDYYQHADNILGHYTKTNAITVQKLREMARSLKSGLRSGPVFESLKALGWKSRDVYFNDIIRIILFARVLQLRCQNAIKKKKAIIRQFAGLERSVFWLVIQTGKGWLKRRSTLGAEFYCLRSFLIFRLMNSYFRMKRDAYLSRTLGVLAVHSSSSTLKVDAVGSVDVIQQKIAPLKVVIAKEAKRRVNVLIPTVNFRYFFGGYIGKFNFALQLAREGFHVRLVIVDYCEFNPEHWKQEIKNYSGLHNFFDIIEVAYNFDRAVPVTVNPDDAFIATTWWTAHIAHKAVAKMRSDRFIYFIQEYEPFTFPMGTFYALAEQTYQFPHYAIFSTELLRDYFRQNKIGVFNEPNPQQGELYSVSFENAIQRFTVDKHDLRERKVRKFLFYARPEQHASRNMFEMGVLALVRVIEEGYFDRDVWEFYGMGSVSHIESIRLHGDVHLNLLQKMTLREYADLLPGFDLGLSLMFTPHPSLPPIEMAAAGMVVVTNTFANKTRERLAAISSNIIAVDPTVESVKTGIIAALERVHNYEDRIKGSHVNWSADWSRSFNEDIMSRIKSFIVATSDRDVLGENVPTEFTLDGIRK
jgi:glycosyltransferase involved in cell wall biosynthesis